MDTVNFDLKLTKMFHFWQIFDQNEARLGGFPFSADIRGAENSRWDCGGWGDADFPVGGGPHLAHPPRGGISNEYPLNFNF